MRVLVLVVFAAGCFDKPPAPATTDGRAVDATVCRAYGMWPSSGTQIDLAVLDDDAATSPWLSPSRDEIYFTVLPGGSGPPTIMHSTLVAGAWMQPTVVVLGGTSQNDNPFMADDGALWFDNADGPARVIYEAQAVGGGFGRLIAHPELAPDLAGAKEPSVSPDGHTIYYANVATTQLYTSIDGAASQMLTRSTTASIESPSVSGDGSTLYFSDYTNGELISEAAISGASLSGIQNLAPFQVGGSFFDPDISRDGTTLVFAALTQAAPHARLFYVQRTCLP